MIKQLVPQSKLGTPYQSPSWRYQALYFPERFGLGWMTSKREVNAAHLQRLIPKGLQVSSAYNIPAYFQELLRDLPNHLAEILLKVWNKHYFAQYRRKATFSSAVSQSVPISWNLTKVKENLNDEFLTKIILHCYNHVFDPYIDEAIKFYKDINNSMNRKWMNYSYYCGLSDAEMAKTWGKSLGFVKALRLMFFDYSHWPKDRLAQFSLIRQLVSNQEIDDQDYHFFRRIYDLGRVGLKSVIGLHKLTPDESRQVEQYLGSSSIDNILNLKYTIVDSKTAQVFDRAITNYTGNRLKKIEIEQRNKYIELTTEKMAREMGLGEEKESMFAEERELMELLKDYTKVNHQPKFPSFIEIKQENAKINIESDPQKT